MKGRTVIEFELPNRETLQIEVDRATVELMESEANIRGLDLVFRFTFEPGSFFRLCRGIPR